MYTVRFKNTGEIEIEKPHNSITIRHIDGDIQITKSIAFTRAKPEVFPLVKGKYVEFDDLETGTVFKFDGAAPWEVMCELN
jgi:hypothetical protein